MLLCGFNFIFIFLGYTRISWTRFSGSSTSEKGLGCCGYSVCFSCQVIFSATSGINGKIGTGL